MKFSKVYDLFFAAHEMSAAIQHGKKPSRAMMLRAEMPETVIKRFSAS